MYLSLAEQTVPWMLKLSSENLPPPPNKASKMFFSAELIVYCSSALVWYPFTASQAAIDRFKCIF